MNGSHRLLLALLALPTPALFAADPPPDVYVLQVREVWVGDGTVLSPAAMWIDHGRIRAIGASVNAPAGTPVIEKKEGVLTPGFIDAAARIEGSDLRVATGRPAGNFASPLPAPAIDPELKAALEEHDHAVADPDNVGLVGEICPLCAEAYDHPEGATAAGLSDDGRTTEARSEVVPHTRVIDSLNLASSDFERLLRSGVTTVCAVSDSSAVIGPRAAILLTGGPENERVIAKTGAVSAAMNSEPFYSGLGNSSPNGFFVSGRWRRPTTRMGVAWVFRKALADASHVPLGEELRGSDHPPREALPVLEQLVRGEIPLFIHARQQNDIESALRMTAEFGVKSFTLVEGTDAWLLTAPLKARGVPVILGPLDRARQGVDATEYRDRNAKTLLDAGLEVALSARDRRDEDGLRGQAELAVAAGLTRQQALAAVTSTPAKLLGIADRAGTLAADRRADLVLWSRDPFEATAQVDAVWLGGRPAYVREQPAPPAATASASPPIPSR